MAFQPGQGPFNICTEGVEKEASRGEYYRLMGRIEFLNNARNSLYFELPRGGAGEYVPSKTDNKTGLKLV